MTQAMTPISEESSDIPPCPACDRSMKPVTFKNLAAWKCGRGDCPIDTVVLSDAEPDPAKPAPRTPKPLIVGKGQGRLL
jgi:hypothetical protein